MKTLNLQHLLTKFLSVFILIAECYPTLKSLYIELLSVRALQLLNILFNTWGNRFREKKLVPKTPKDGAVQQIICGMTQIITKSKYIWYEILFLR